MYYSDFIEEGTYLAHHGVKGQKWGVRRYQNPDGSLTAEGERRYGTVEKLRKSRDYKKYRKAEYKKAMDKINSQGDKHYKEFRKKSEDVSGIVKDSIKTVKKGWKENGLTRRDRNELIRKLRNEEWDAQGSLGTQYAITNHKIARLMQAETIKYYEDIGKTNSLTYRRARQWYDDNSSAFSNYTVRQSPDGRYHVTRTIYM